MYALNNGYAWHVYLQALDLPLLLIGSGNGKALAGESARTQAT